MTLDEITTQMQARVAEKAQSTVKSSYSTSATMAR